MGHRPESTQVLKDILQDWIDEEFDDVIVSVIVIPSLTKFGIWYSMEKILMDVIIGFLKCFIREVTK
jgi:hypothetical protein